MHIVLLLFAMQKLVSEDWAVLRGNLVERFYTSCTVLRTQISDDFLTLCYLYNYFNKRGLAQFMRAFRRLISRINRPASI